MQLSNYLVILWVNLLLILWLKAFGDTAYYRCIISPAFTCPQKFPLCVSFNVFPSTNASDGLEWRQASRHVGFCPVMWFWVRPKGP